LWIKSHFQLTASHDSQSQISCVPGEFFIPARR
jgi:hypothetical protein